MKQNFRLLILFFGIISFGVLNKETHAQKVDSLLQNKIDGIADFLLYRNHDTTFISNYPNEVAVKLVAVNKYNYFNITDRVNDSRLRYRPVRDLSLGAGVTYKWFALDLTFALGLYNKSEFENTKTFDFQGTMFTSKQYISATLQYYWAYQVANISGSVPVNPESERRDDIRTINFGLQYMYVFNYTKFSLKAPFVFNEVQLKSAGSPILGVSFSMFNMGADSSIVPPEAAPSFDSTLYLSGLNVISAAINLGYMYTFVVREHFFLTLGVIPGLNVNAGDYFVDTREPIHLNAHFKLNFLGAIGYNGRRWFTGIQFISDTYYSRLEKKMIAGIGHGKTSLFVGYRFKTKKK